MVVAHTMNTTAFIPWIWSQDFRHKHLIVNGDFKAEVANGREAQHRVPRIQHAFDTTLFMQVLDQVPSLLLDAGCFRKSIYWQKLSMLN